MFLKLLLALAFTSIRGLYGCKDSCDTCSQYNANNCYSCKAGYYNDLWSSDCSLTCPGNCFSCTSNTYCSSCKDGFYNGWDNRYWYDCRLPCYSGCKSCTTYGSCNECKDGYYGDYCTSKCNPRCKKCTDYYVCSECKNGFFGPACQYNCSAGCRDNVCDTHDGYCDCVSSTYWGEKCENTCSGGCASLYCSKDSGKCRDGCLIGFVGDRCDTCANGYYYINARCAHCPQNCRSCVSDKTCNECNNGFFGQTCKDTCAANCLNSICNIHTGLCLACTQGFGGIKCNEICSNNCLNRSCNTDSSCMSCQPGAYGAFCDMRCPKNCISCTSYTTCTSCKPGYYGDICEKECSNCLEGTTCSKYYGVCDTGCKDGWYNSYCQQMCDQKCKACDRYNNNICTKCTDGRYGEGSWVSYSTCDSFCPLQCLNKRCDFTTGQCTDGCVKGWWGSSCSKTCPVNCFNGDCYHNNGSCIKGCMEGYEGNVCDCPTNCECDAVGICSRCNKYFSNVIKNCACRTDICLEESCSRCSNESFYSKNNECCPCSSNCKDSVCVSAFNCSLGCKSGYYGNDCAKMCSDYDQLCEECPVIYGPTNGVCHQCKPGYYPFQYASYGYNRCVKCPNTCLDSECDGATGECIKGCVDKKWGLACQNDCPINCHHCDRSNGSCSVCEGGKYLFDCSQSCSASCNTTEGQLLCQIENGACLNGCVSLNIYGAHCEKNCSKNCKDNVCSWLTGDCVKGCQSNHWGNQCEHVCSPNCISVDGATTCNEKNGHCLSGCIDGYYSILCEKTCSINCLNTSCDARGRCVYGCFGDFVDDSCLQVKFEEKQDSVGSAATIGGIVGGVVVLVIIIGVVIVVVVLKRRHRKDEANTKRENNHSNDAVRFSEVVESGRQNERDDSVPVYATPDKQKLKKDAPQSHTVNNPSYQRPSVAMKHSVTEKVAAVYQNAVLREDARVEDSKPKSDTSLSHENLTRASKTRQSLGRYLLELEDPNENVGSSSRALALESSGSHVKESEVGDTYYNTAEVFKRKIPLDKLAEFVGEKTRKGFEEEFKLLPEGLIKKYTESQKKDNITKNRYRGIYPYDDTRVVLRDGESDYINASYIDGYKKLKAYIASLGPTYKYMDDMSAFWRMVWQEKCGKIIMLTKLMEGGTRKCDQYWPEKDSSQLYADINVTCLSEETYADYTVRVLNIQKESAKRTVTQVHFTAWPDQGVPDDVTCLIEFRQRVVSVKTNLDGPILVHCSAGIGRTGTYIALDSLTKEGESEGSVDIYACVRNLREQRVNMVQTAEQYEYLHTAVVHSLTFDSHAIQLNHFQQYMTTHDTKTLAHKFHDLEHSVEKRSKDEIEAIKKNSAMMEKNRKGADIPGDRNRPRLYLHLKPGASDYINALYVNSYRHLNRFILAQTPLPGTVDDFLTLVVQEKCSCIVNMEPETNKSKDVGNYYPADNQTLKRGTFTVRTERVSSSQNFTHRRLTISNHGKAGIEDHIVQHFQLTSWVDGMKCPDDATSFLDFLHHVEFKSGGAEAGPVLVHCLTGAEKCGLFCVVDILLEKIQCDQEVSVVNTVRQVKSRRYRVIPNQEQYVFCHQCVNEYIRSFDNYSNFASRQ